MTDCVSHDQLVDLVSVLDPPASVTVDHLSSCPTCRGELAALEQVRGLLRPEERASTQFVDSVMQRIESAAKAAPHAGGQGHWIARVQAAGSRTLAAVLTGLAVAVVLVTVGSSAPAGIDYSPVAAIAGGLLGCGLTVYHLMRFDREEIGTTRGTVR